MHRHATVILFDAVGTLIYPHPAVADVYCRWGRQFGSRLDPPAIAARFGHAMRHFHRGGEPRKPAARHAATAAAESLPSSEARERRRWRRVVQEVFAGEVADTERLFEALWNHFALPRHWRLYDDVAPAWQALARSGYRLGVASNFDERLAGIWPHLQPPPGDVKCGLFLSAQLGHAKPSPAFFAAVQQHLDVPPGQILLVGDDRVNDYLGARAAGWQAALLQRVPAADGRGDLRRLTQLPARLRAAGPG